MRVRRAVATALGALLLTVGAAASSPSTERWSSAAIAGCIRDPRCERVFVVAHRAEGFDAPENSRTAVARAVQAGVPVVEIDLRATQEGELFVLHDGRLDRVTTARGRVETTPAATVAAARLRNGEPVPRFPDIYELTRGRAMLRVDFKTEPVALERIAEWIQQHGSFDDLIFFVNTGEEMMAAAQLKRRYPEMIVMVRLLDTRVTVESTRAVFGRLPEIFHTDRVGPSEVSRLHALGVKVYMSGLPLDRYFEPFRNLAFRWLLRAKADFVLTSDPIALMRRVGSR